MVGLWRTVSVGRVVMPLGLMLAGELLPNEYSITHLWTLCIPVISYLSVTISDYLKTQDLLQVLLNTSHR